MDVDFQKFLPEFLKDKSTAFILLVASFFLVVFAIIYNRFFIHSFLTFLYALWATNLVILRKHDNVTQFSKKRPTLYIWFLCIWLICFNLLFFIWITIMVGIFQYEDEFFSMNISSSLPSIISNILNFGVPILIGFSILLFILYFVGTKSSIIQKT